MRPEELYLADILQAADAVQRFIQGVERHDFFGDDLRQSAVLQKLIVNEVRTAEDVKLGFSV